MGRRTCTSCSKDTARVLPSADKKRTCEDKLKSSPLRFSATFRKGSSKAIEAANQYLSNSKNPSYAIVMQSSYLRLGYLHVPSNFVQEMHANPGANNVKLEFLGKVYKAVFYNMGRFSRIGEGWSTSVKESSLEEGDVCALELINRENGVTIRVSVFKSTT